MRHSILIILIAFLNWCCTNSDRLVQQRDPIDTAGYSLKVIDNLHDRLTLKDYDESLVNYMNSAPNKVDSTRKVVYLLPFGNMKPEVEEIIQSELKYLAAFLQLKVKLLDRISYDSIKK